MRYLRVDEVLALEPAPAPVLRVARTFPPVDPALAGPAGPERVPTGLVLELMATAGGALAAHVLGGRHLPLLVQAEGCEFPAACRRGERLLAVAALEGPPGDGQASGARASVEVWADGRRVAAGRFLYLCVPAGALPALLEGAVRAEGIGPEPRAAAAPGPTPRAPRAEGGAPDPIVR